MAPNTSSNDSNPDLTQILADLRNQKFLIINSRRKNGLIINKQHYAEFAGPGAVVGSIFDRDAIDILPVGNWSLAGPQTSQDRQRAYLIRRQWLKLIQQITDNEDAQERAKLILKQFENWFDAQTVEEVPDGVLGRLVGVLPKTIAAVRQARQEQL